MHVLCSVEVNLEFWIMAEKSKNLKNIDGAGKASHFSIQSFVSFCLSVLVRV